MPIVIYTYTDPYQLPRESYWDEIRTCPYFCAAQTLVNGLRSLYMKDFVQGRVTTVQNLLTALFRDWESTAYKIRQHAEIDNAVSGQSFLPTDSAVRERMERAFSSIGMRSLRVCGSWRSWLWMWMRSESTA